MVSVRFRALTTKPLRLEFAKQIDEVRVFVEAHLDRIEAEVKPYPPVPGPPNRYQRTNNLLGSWGRRGSTTGTNIDRFLVVNIDGQAPYARFVVGDIQRPYHAAHGWKRLSEHTHQGEFNAGIRALYARMRIV